jgi:hypothetical protein
MINTISGVNFFTNLLNIDYEDVKAAFSFRSNSIINTNIINPDPWANYSSSGILNTVGGNGFFNYSGTGYFNGNTYFKLSNNYNLSESSLILLSFERLSSGNQILLSSTEGTSFNTFSGFLVGVNDANKLYIKYWNNVEGPFTFIYENVLSDKNLILINRDNTILTLGHFNNNKFIFETENFNIFQNNFINSNNLYVGGQPTLSPWGGANLKYFNGYIDKLYIFDNTPLNYATPLVQGFYSEPTGIQGELEETCFITGFLKQSGFSYTGITGILSSGYLSGISTITGYQNIISGYNYSGITGYKRNSLGIYIDNCGNSTQLFEDIPLSGLISNQIEIKIPLISTNFVQFFVDIPLTGRITGNQTIYVTGLLCNSYFNNTGDILYKYDENYLKSLSYKEISLLSELNDNNNIEIFTESYQNKFLEYNKDLIYDNVFENYFYLEREYNKDEILLFGNGQALIEDRFQLILSGYETIRSPNIDYFLTGTTIETNKFFGDQDYLFYDNISGRSWFIKNTGFLVNTPLDLGSNYWVFRNGQKLIEGVNNDYIKSPWLVRQSFTGGFGDSAFNTNFLARLAINSDASTIFLGANLDGEGGFRAGKIEIYTGSKELGWEFKQKILGTANRTLGTDLICSSNGKVLLSNNLNTTNIFTGDSITNYLAPSFNIPYDITNGTLNNDGSIIIVSSSRHGNPNFPERISGVIDIYTGNPNLGTWSLKQSITGRISGNLQIINITNDGSLFLATEFNYIPSGSGYLYSGNPELGWNLKQSFSLNGSGAFYPANRINKNGNILALSNTNGLVQLYSGNLNSQWNLIKNNINTSQSSVINLSDDGNLLFISNARFISSSETNIYKINPFFLLQSLPNKGIRSSSINNDGNILGLGTFDTSDARGFVDIYIGEPFKLFINNININEENNILIKEIPDNFIYQSGNFGSFKLTGSFNHGCSQVYFNGIKQKIDNNYIENSNFDLISGNFYELDNFDKDVIYNNTDDFFV